MKNNNTLGDKPILQSTQIGNVVSATNHGRPSSEIDNTGSKITQLEDDFMIMKSEIRMLAEAVRGMRN